MSLYLTGGVQPSALLEGKQKPQRWALGFMEWVAVGEGFEPSVQSYPYGSLANY